MKRDLTLAKLKTTSFETLYSKFIVGDALSVKECEAMLALAICFINAADESIQWLGYRIIVNYCNNSNDYAPLYEIAINKGLYPISKFIEQHRIPEERRNFFTEWNDAFTEKYAQNGIYQSEQQRTLSNFFAAKTGTTISVIAPTSYGKSELILSALYAFAEKKVCIVTSTKALLMQTKKRIQQIGKNLFAKIIVHPEMYNSNDPSCLAVLTQERLLRLMKTDPLLAFDCIIIDEAHEMLEKGDRGQTLATSIIIAQKRNPKVVFKFLTPFLADESNLKIRYTSYDIDAFRVTEYIKSEKYYVYDVRQRTGLKLFDQFMNVFYDVHEDESLLFEEDVVKNYSAEKNIVYLNKPADIERFALSLAELLPEVQSERITAACNHISDYLQPQYNLLACLRKGIIYHHGSVPDAIRIYIEELYKTEPAIKYVVTSSTLLSGVNLPAERMFILDNRRGRANLRPDAFKNLVGRVCRFSEIFDSTNGSLKRLSPEIYLVYGKYFAQKANVWDFLKKVAKIGVKYQDDADNILLKNVDDAARAADLKQAEEFVENYEKGTISDYSERYVQTDAGKAYIMNNVSEIDIFANEHLIQATVNQLRIANSPITTTAQLMDTLYDLVIKHLPDKDDDNLSRLKNPEARKFYAMLFEWRMNDKSYSEMIQLFVRYWAMRFHRDRNAIIYVGKWGDIALPGGVSTHYTRLADKDRTQIVNLAIVRIKEEQDFIDNVLIKYVEAVHDLKLLDGSFYARIKYGTDDESTICLLKNGLSLSSAVLLLKRYHQYITLDIPNSTVAFSDPLIDAMKANNENMILIHEIQNCM